MVGDLLLLHRAEGPQPHMERHIAQPDPHLSSTWRSSSGVKCRLAVGAAWRTPALWVDGLIPPRCPGVCLI